VRIGVSAAKGICWAKDIKAAGVSTLEAMAYQLSSCGGVICAAMDARRNEVYNALFGMREGKLVRLCEDRAISLIALEKEMKESGKEYTLVGDGAELAYKFMADKGVNVHLAPENIRYQSAWGVAMAAIGAIAEDAGSLKPEYLRLSQAEREKKESEMNSRKNEF
jgi:tRNA threonylcarbamoyladenosine biosynthesis protein TsaB